MRDIKFRAWHNNNNKMTYFSLFEKGQFYLLGNQEGNISFDAPIMQYTGLKDSNGVEIYEGDILDYAPYHNLGHLSRTIDAVGWDETGDSDGWRHNRHYEYTVGCDSLADVADSEYEDESYCAVIGNIYENPELLGSEK